MERLSTAINSGWVRSCHDCSEGGIGVAAAEMAFAGGYGMSLSLDGIPTGEEIGADDFLLFSESNSRFLVEIEPRHQHAYESHMAGNTTWLPWHRFRHTRIRHQRKDWTFDS